MTDKPTAEDFKKYEDTEREKRIDAQRALAYVLDLYEDAVNDTEDYCLKRCPIREYDYCPAFWLEKHQTEDGLEFYTQERDWEDCIRLRIEWYTKEASGKPEYFF